IVIGIFEDFDSIAWFCSRRCAEGIFIKLQHPQAATFIPSHRHWIDYIRFGREEPDFETLRHDKFFLRLGWGERRTGRRGIFASELLARAECCLRGQKEKAKGLYFHS